MSEFEVPQPYAEPFGSRRQWAAPATGAILALTGALLCAGAVALVAASVPSDAAFGRGLLELLIIGTPVAAGLYALRTGANPSFAYALIWVGFAWSLTALSESSLSVPYTIGRLSTWLVFPAVVYLLLAFPSGRVSPGLDRALFVGVLAVSVVLFYGTAPLVLAYPPHTLWATCTTACPANAVALVDTPPAFLTQVVYLREWLVMLLWAGLFWSMFRRFRAASPLGRNAMAPVFGAAAVLGVLHISFHAARELGAPAQTVIDLSSAWTLAIVGVCAAFLLGFVWRRMLLGRTLARLGPALRESDSPTEMREALASALGDPSLELLAYDADSGAWHDASDRPRSWPQPLPAGRAATSISAGDDTEKVVLLHDVALRDEQELLDGAAAIVLAGWRHERMAADLVQAMEDLEQSRRRIAEAAVHERARIERDLHDGAQQRLVALRINVALAAERLETDPAAAVADIGELAFEVDRALEELRSLAHGVYPAVLADLGLAAALRSLRTRGALPVHVAESGLERHPIELETAVYFTCVEALQNAMKHADGATGVWIRLRESPEALEFEVSDDGRGVSADAEPGHGLRNMRDRIEALGGRLSVERHAGGTRVVGRVPLAER